MRRLSLVNAMLVLIAVSAHAELTDPEDMANAIRQSGRDCNEVKSMKESDDPKQKRVYHVVCDGDNKYTVVLRPDDTVLVEND